MVSVSPLTTRVAMRDMEVVDDACRSAFGCGGVDLSTIVTVLLTGVLAFLVFAAIVQVREAISVVEKERERLTAERDAFDEFSRRVADIDVNQTSKTSNHTSVTIPAAGGLATATTTSSTTDQALDRVLAAYRDTVMDVPHYEADYGETLVENLSAEFGDGIAYAVTEGRRFTPQLKSALLASSQEASRSRSSFLSTIEAESKVLSEAADSMAEIDEEREAIAATPPTQLSYEELVSDWDRLGELEDRCRSMALDRQERSRALSGATPSDAPDLHEYLYEELPVSHPVLSDLASLSEAVASLRSRTLRSLTRRV